MFKIFHIVKKICISNFFLNNLIVSILDSQTQNASHIKLKIKYKKISRIIKYVAFSVFKIKHSNEWLKDITIKIKILYANAIVLDASKDIIPSNRLNFHWFTLSHFLKIMLSWNKNDSRMTRKISILVRHESRMGILTRTILLTQTSLAPDRSAFRCVRIAEARRVMLDGKGGKTYLNWDIGGRVRSRWERKREK